MTSTIKRLLFTNLSPSRGFVKHTAAIVALALSTATAACGSSETDASSAAAPTSSQAGSGDAGAGGSGSGGSGGAGGGAACAPSFDGDTLRLAAGMTLGAGEESTLCLRWTSPKDIPITSLVGTLGPAAGHHALLIAQNTPTEPDGLAPCSEAELMDAQKNGGFQMLAGVSYESDGVKYDFPASPVQVGLFVPAGTQLIFDAHFLNPSPSPVDACASLDLFRGEPVVAKLEFRTVLPVEQYGLLVPAASSTDMTYEEPSGGAYRIAAASSHMHEGGTHFRMSIQPGDITLYETTQWADPQPALFDKTKIIVKDTDSFRLDCSFKNSTGKDQHFPEQMCVGGMYVLPCSLPGAC